MKRFKFNNWVVSSIVILSVIFFSIRLYNLIKRQAVNVLFFDQWDFLTPLFEKPTAWEMFTRQHGPHRQGLGLFLSQAIGLATGWDTRAECYGIGVILLLTAIAAIILKKRLFGKLTLWDVLIPAIVLSPTQIEAVTLTPNPAHGALPIFLVVVSGLILTLKNVYLRYISLVVITFFATFTGFGFFLGIVTPVLLAAAFVIHLNNKDKNPAICAGVALLISLMSFAAFFIGYIFSSVEDCYQFPFSHLVNYFSFVSLEFAFFIGFYFMDHAAIAETVGFIIFIWLVVIAAIQAYRIWKTKIFESQNFVIVLFIPFSLIFVVNSAAGRICSGVAAAQTSRYMTLLIPCLLGLYFSIQDIFKRNLLTAVNSLLIVLFIIVPVLGFNKFNKVMDDYSHVKKIWADCYIEQKSIEGCNQKAGSVVYPAPESTHMKEKLNLLEEKKYNLFNAK